MPTMLRAVRTGEPCRGGCSDVCGGACFVALQDAEVCDSLYYSGGVCGCVGHGEGDSVFEAGLVFYVAEGKDAVHCHV